MGRVRRMALLVVAMLGLITLPGNWPGLVGVAHAGHFPWDQGHDTFMPEFDDLDTDPGDDDCNNSGSPFEVATGNFLHASIDLFIPTLGPDFDITRTYNSRDRRNGPLGRGWTFTYDQRLIEATDGVSLLVICRQGNGKRERFVRNADGTYTAPPDLSAVLVKHADGTLTLTEKNGEQRRFDAHGRLMAWVDHYGNTMTMRYDDTGFLIGLSDAGGRTVAFTKGANGKIASITDPAGRVFRYDYDADGNLLGFTGPLGSTTLYVYDADHKLVRVSDPVGHVVLQQVSYDNQRRVQTFTEQGETWTVSYFPDQKKTTKQDARGKTWTYFYNDNGNITRLVDPAGGRQDFAYNANFYLSRITDHHGNVTTLTYDTHGNVTTITSTVNGHVFTSTSDPVAKTLTNKTPVGRQSVTTFDDKHRVTQLAFPGLLPIQYTYDDQGRVSEITQGERTYAFAYNDQGFLASLTDPLGHSIRFAYDAAGRVTRQTFSDGREVQYSYDADGNLTTLTPPGRPPHRFTYNPLGQEIEYTTPAVGSEVTRSLYHYGRNHELVHRQRPDGTTLNFGYNAAGQLTNVQLPGGDIELAYNAKTGQLEAITEPGGKVAYTYEDSRLTKTTWLGPITGSVERTYDRHFNLASRSINEAHSVTFQYDPDGLLTAVGPLALSLDPQNALLTGTRLGDVTDAHQYNGYGEEIEYRAAYQNKALLTLQYTRDAIGRIAKHTETIDGRTHTYTYHYDASRRLAAVEQDGHLLARYEYDANGNRLKRTGPAGGTGHYDAQDRLIQYDNTRYTYTAAGDLQATSTAGRRWLILSRQQSTAYDYDALGNLRSANLPDGTRIEYLIDGDNRRIGKKANGSLVQGFLYKDSLKPIAEFDGTGNVVARFVYGTRSHVPDYLIKHGVTYRLLADYRGSPRLVVNVENGEIAQRLEYDEFGSILVDTNPGFQPFGFAGGLYDRHTGLVRFGARDYDPTTGRWTTQDPIRFGGRSPYLYEYAYPVRIRL
jgi:RHS repeat-associated protein